MSVDDLLSWWYGRVDFERRSPVAGELKLDQMRALLRALGEPQRRLRIVHVAGSKGKGSTSAMLASILRQAGYRIGLFTSPHLSQVEERIQIDGEPISRLELVALLTEIRRSVPAGVHPTFFEVGTAAGWLHFVRRRVDLAVVEVGLGGRFDSTNVCTPWLSIITSISYDHVQILGPTLASIAFEKAGIIKPGRPVVSGATDPEARSVIRRVAVERGSRLRELGVDFHATYLTGRLGERLPTVQVETERHRWPPMALGLHGQHQAANAALAVATVEELRAMGLTIRDEHVASGLQKVRWPARLEVLAQNPFVLLDCAHNVASIQAVVKTLIEAPNTGQRWLIFASSSDKDIPGMLQVLAPHVHQVAFTRYAHSARAAAPDALATMGQAAGMASIEVFDSAPEAWRAVYSRASPDDLILVAGSVFLAGELRPIMMESVRRCPRDTTDEK